jgi:ActR/RegA family two-component response regulator
MTDVLIVEDDTFKMERLERCVVEVTSLRPRQAVSVQQAVQALRTSNFDLVVLDMALPSHTVQAGQSPATSLLTGGLEVIMEVAFGNRTEKIVVVTQFPEIDIDDTSYPLDEAHVALIGLFGDRVIAVIQYESGGTAWEAQLQSVLGSS